MLTQQTQDLKPTLNHHWPNVLCLLSDDNIAINPFITIIVLNLFYLLIKSLFKHQDLQMFGLNLNKYE